LIHLRYLKKISIDKRAKVVVWVKEKTKKILVLTDLFLVEKSKN